MIETIKSILSNIKGIDDWKIIEKSTSSRELFFVRQEMDMNRGKDVTNYSVTVYVDFEENEKKYRGSTTVSIYPTMSVEEIRDNIEEGVFAAGFVKNEYYPIPEQVNSSLTGFSNGKHMEVESNFSKGNISTNLSNLSKVLFKEDKFEKGGINSSELFLNKINTRIINSKGIDVSFSRYTSMLEVVTDWKENNEEIEIYRNIEFTQYDEDFIKNEIKDMLNLSRERAIANPTPDIVDCKILLTGEPVKEFFDYSYTNTNAKMVYDGISTCKVGESVQGKNVNGDVISIELDPNWENSTFSVPYDSDGLLLESVEIISDGTLLRYWGDFRHSHYLNVEPTGNISNLVVKEGSKSVSEMKKVHYMELVSFSDFQMDPLTGDFGGEIRLGWYFDGEVNKPITGGSISGNIKEVENEMYFSSEVQKINNFKGPRTIELHNTSIAGIK